MVAQPYAQSVPTRPPLLTRVQVSPAAQPALAPGMHAVEQRRAIAHDPFAQSLSFAHDPP